MFRHRNGVRALVLFVLLASCVRTAPSFFAASPVRLDAAVVADVVRDEPVPTVDAVVAPAALRLEDRLRAYVVNDDAPARGVLYSWLPLESARSLVQDRVLLRSVATGGTYVSPFHRLLRRWSTSRVALERSVAQEISTNPLYARRRYAWAWPYPTARGFTGTSYGTVLVRIELRPEALLMRWDPSRDPSIVFHDQSQRVLPSEQWETLLPRVGAIYHVRTGGDIISPFREYVLSNPRMVRSWELGTPEINAEILSEISLVDALLVRAEVHRGGQRTEHRWSGVVPNVQLQDLWMATMATSARHYTLRRQNLQALRRELERYDNSVVFSQVE